jgi:ABC-type antimicrobial peptide transport system permease subunit
MTVLNTLLSALRGVSANRLRAALTMLGVVIGVAAVIAMLALGNGARAAVESSFRFLGSDNIQISAKQKMDDGAFSPVGKILSYSDGVEMPRDLELIDRVEMLVGQSVRVRHDRNVFDMTISGTTAEALESYALKAEVQPVNWPEGEPLSPEVFLEEGRMFTPVEVIGGANVCVIGHKTAEKLFEGDNALGETIWVNRLRCLVIGVIVEMETTDPSQRYTSEPNEFVLMPISSAIRELYEDEPSVTMTAHVTDESRMEEAKSQVAAYLRERHGVEKNGSGTYDDDFDLTTRSDVLGAQQEAARTFSLLLAAMAVVSLAVGGIGIMNVMLVSVTERTREIGVRMAVGARSSDIVWQFLLESVVLSASGGIVGIAVGVLTIPFAASLNRGVALLDPGSIPLAFCVAVIIGILFGLYPAVRASRLDPIEALRYE